MNVKTLTYQGEKYISVKDLIIHLQSLAIQFNNTPEISKAFAAVASDIQESLLK